MKAPNRRQRRTAAAHPEADAAIAEPADLSPRVWRWPTVIGMASLVGLVSALLGDGIWDVLSWVTLSVPLAIAWVAWRRALTPSS